MLLLTEIIENIKKSANLKTDTEVAYALEMKPKSLSGAKVRNNIPFVEIINFCKKEHISSNLIFGIKETKPMTKPRNSITIEAVIKVFNVKNANDAYDEIAELERLYNSIYPLKRLHITLPKRESEKYLQALKEEWQGKNPISVKDEADLE